MAPKISKKVIKTKTVVNSGTETPPADTVETKAPLVEEKCNSTEVVESTTVVNESSEKTDSKVETSTSKTDGDSSSVSPAVVSIPKNTVLSLESTLREQQLTFAKQVAQEFNLDFDEVVKKCFPDAPEVKVTTSSKPKKKSKPEKITDYKDAKALEDLKVFKQAELKTICQEHSLPVSGTKERLMARVWGILHPDEAPVEEKKPKSKSKKKTETVAPVIVEELEETGDTEVELDPDNMTDFFVDKDGVECQETESTESYKLFQDKWLFSIADEEIDFVGVKNGSTVEKMDETPEELMALLGMN